MTIIQNVVPSCILRPPLFFGYEQTTSKYARKIYKDGKIIIGGLLKTHYSETGNQCNRLSTTDLGNAKAMIYAIERMNTNFTLVPNVPIGYELRDYCWSGALVTQIAYELMRGNYPGLIKAPAFFEQLCHEKQSQGNLSTSCTFQYCRCGTSR